MAESYIFKRLQLNLGGEVVQNFKFLHCENNIAKLIQTFQELHIKFSHNILCCVKTDGPSVGE